MKSIVLALTALIVAGTAAVPASAAVAPHDYTAKELKAALIQKKAGYKTLHIAAGTAGRFAAGKSGIPNWAFSGLPARCRTAGTTGLLWDKSLLAEFSATPAAAVELSGTGHALGASLVSVPDSLPASIFRARVPKACASLLVSYQGKRIQVKIAPIPVADLPVIKGASVSGVVTTLPAGLWGHKTGSQKALIVVHYKTFVLETYTDAFGSVKTTSISWTAAAWRRAIATLG
jgi:hypothetical protein